MSRVALLVGASGNPPELNRLPWVQTDLKGLERVLRQFTTGFMAVSCLVDRPLQETQAAIEAFFMHRAPDDELLFLFAGYAMLDMEGKLYFTAPITAPDVRGALAMTCTIPADFLQTVMNRSPAQRQTLILDCCFRQAFGSEPVAAESAVDLSPLLGDRRVILTASTTTHHLPPPTPLEVWSYTRYLIDGIESTAADGDGNGALSAQELHDYACRKLAIAAPGSQADLIGSKEVASLPLMSINITDPRSTYRRFVEGYSTPDRVDPASLQFLNRNLLDATRHGLQLSPQDAQQVEFEALRPLREVQHRLQVYREQAIGLTDEPDSPARQRLRQALALTARETAVVDAATVVDQRRRQREQEQRHLAQYEQVLLSTLERRYPLEESDRQGLQHLQQVLGLRGDDVQAIERQIMDQVERQQGLSAQSEPLGQETVSDTREVTMAQPESTVPDGSSQMAPTQLPPLAAEHPQTLPPEELSGQTLPPASGLSPQKEAILHRALRLQNVSYTASDMPPDAARSGQPLNPPPDPPANPPPENPPLSSPPPPVSRPPSAAANTLKALLIPGLILAALLGALIALLLPQLLPRDLLPGWLGGTEQPVDIVLVQDLIRQGGSELQRGRYEDALKHYNEAIRLDRNAYDAYIGRGLANHRLGRRNEALRDYNRAIELIETERKSLNAGPGSVNLDPVLAQAYNNRSHVQFDLEQFPAAKDDANKAVTLNTNLAEAYINLGNARARLGELNESLQDYETAIRLKPGNTQLAGAYTNRGNVQVKLNQPPTAVQDYNRATQVKADYADAFFNRGIAHQLQKKYQNALADLQEAARLYGQQGNTRMQQRAEDLAKQVQQNQQLPNPPTADSL